MIEILKYKNYFEITIISVLLNAIILLISVFVYHLLSKTLVKQKFREASYPIYKKDIILLVVVLLCNAIIFIIGVILWKNEYIILHENATFLDIALKTILLIFCMDFLMYFFHRLMHSKILFPLVHKRHHEHDSTNSISLFVLHPIEAIGFGMLIIALLYVFHFPPESIAIYLSINLLWGTIAHLNVEVLPKKISHLFLINTLGTAKFHNIHHQNINYNFGFYTLVWDKLFNTLRIYPLDNEEEKSTSFY
ncbi:sterol desaturase family protein [Salmonirosea aquatica]|uniref:Fatty acid hydroxylase family protein n=1 Tax=Salmonirosea aquatica TaxID=2654236 RepID=A0A7C9B853_9BACT|nr:fatty acid hydroxylase family protein [Cytophagaceae bacterium SJW1-29]